MPPQDGLDEEPRQRQVILDIALLNGEQLVCPPFFATTT